MVVLDLETGYVWIRGRSVKLTHRERQIVRDMIKNDYVIPEEWDLNHALTQHIFNLRAKGLNIDTRHGYELKDKIELIGD